jgi:4,4'-diaponeurosporenoate glycosyltransferase
MMWMVWLAGAGLLAGFWLMWRVPVCPAATVDRFEVPSVSIVIPARDEEANLPRLLQSLNVMAMGPGEILVVDDGSTDQTAEVAVERGAKVVKCGPLPEGWIGKSWACQQGAKATKGNALLFLDADTWFEQGGYERLLTLFARKDPERTAISLLPYHRVERLYEELSVYFDLLMAMGTGGFGLLQRPRLFGQSLMIRRDVYESSGGHAEVRGEILENFRMAANVTRAGFKCCCRGGRGVLSMRMYPKGFGQLCEGWTKGFAQGAAGTSRMVLALSVCWLSSAFLAFVLLLVHPEINSLAVVVLYCAFAMQLLYLSRRVGTYSVLTSALYPIPLVFYFALFGQAVLRRALGGRVSWRGREL